MCPQATTALQREQPYLTFQTLQTLNHNFVITCQTTQKSMVKTTAKLFFASSTLKDRNLTWKFRSLPENKFSQTVSNSVFTTKALLITVLLTRTRLIGLFLAPFTSFPIGPSRSTSRYNNQLGFAFLLFLTSRSGVTY